MNLSRSLSLVLLLCLLAPLGRLSAQEGDVERRSAREAEAKLLSGIRQLTFEGRRAGEGYFSPDGRWMIFQSEREAGNPWYQIYLMDLETGDTERVSPGHGKTTCAWIHPDLNRVLYASTHEDPRSVQLQKEELDFRASGKERRYAWDYDEHFDIFVHDRAKGTDLNLTNARGYDAEGSFSPDGEWIAFSSNRHAYTEPLTKEDRERLEVDKSLFLDLYVMRSNGYDVRRITTTRGYDGGPFFSPDGKKLCWRRFSENGLTAEIFTGNVDGTDQRQLTRIGAMSWAPYFHPSQQYLIFTTNKHGFGNFELYLVDAKGEREPVRVTHTGGFDGLPVFLPDGKRLAWTTNRTRNRTSQIFIAGWDHEAAMRLLRGAPLRRGGAAAKASGPAASSAASVPAIVEADLARDVNALTAPEMAGRLTGSPGERAATEYVAKRFEKIGLEPAQGGEGWFQPFTSTIVLDEGKRRLELSGRNVLGRLRCGKKGAPVVIIGAHVDHLGKGEVRGSRASGDQVGKVHPGADDNASGVAALCEVAEWLVAAQREGKLKASRDILFAAWSGEEMGLLGSKFFVDDVVKSFGRDGKIPHIVAAYLNLDMVGRLDKELILSGIGSSPDWAGEIERRNAPVGLPLSLVDDCSLPTDATPFYLAGVPILSAFTGAHGDYHTPADTADRLDYAGMQRVARFMALMTRGLAMRQQAPAYTEHQDVAKRASRENLKPYLGTIPDYAEAPIPGLKLSGVATGGPAHAGGVRGGDIIVELAGVKIANIYDYTKAIEKVTVGKACKVIVVREGQRRELTIIPGSRE